MFQIIPISPFEPLSILGLSYIFKILMLEQWLNKILLVICDKIFCILCHKVLVKIKFNICNQFKLYLNNYFTDKLYMIKS